MAPPAAAPRRRRGRTRWLVAVATAAAAAAAAAAASRGRQFGARPPAGAEAPFCGASAARGWRPQQEDTVACFWVPGGGRAAVVVDGHEGGRAAATVAATLPPALEVAMARLPVPPTEAAVKRALLSSFNAAATAVDANADVSGAVAALALAPAGLAAAIAVAWLGDSAVLLCDGRGGVRLTVDHSPLNPAEAARVAASGGTLAPATPGGPLRLQGELAVTRAFGDAGYRDAGLAATAEAAVARTARCAFALVASDGVLDVLPVAVACSIASDVLEGRLLASARCAPPAAAAPLAPSPAGAVRAAPAWGGPPPLNTTAASTTPDGRAEAAARAVVCAALAAGARDNLAAAVLAASSAGTAPPPLGEARPAQGGAPFVLVEQLGAAPGGRARSARAAAAPPSALAAYAPPGTCAAEGDDAAAAAVATAIAAGLSPAGAALAALAAAPAPPPPRRWPLSLTAARAALTDAAASIAVGLGMYRVAAAPFARGGRAAAFRAVPAGGGRSLVLKRLPPDAGDEADHELAVGVALRAACAGAAGGAFPHPGCASLLPAAAGFADAAGARWLVFDDGGDSLAALMYAPAAGGAGGGSRGVPLARTPWAAAAAADPAVAPAIARALFAALDAAAGAGASHGDVKPANLLVARGGDPSPSFASSASSPPVVRLADWGCATLRTPDGAVARAPPAGCGGGTAAYAPPEVRLAPALALRAPPPPWATDAWAAGVTLAEILVGPGALAPSPRAAAALRARLPGAPAAHVDAALFLRGMVELCLYPPRRESGGGPAAPAPAHCADAAVAAALADRGGAASPPPLAAVRLLRSLLSWDPGERPSAAAALASEWLRG